MMGIDAVGVTDPVVGRPQGIPAPEGERLRPGTKDPIVEDTTLSQWWSRQPSEVKVWMIFAGLTLTLGFAHLATRN